MKAINLTFQRNGVSGESFYQFVYKHTEDGMRKQMTFVATFDVQEEDVKEPFIKWQTCRVTSVEEPTLCWRGDRISADIQRYIYKTYGTPDNTDGNTFYDLIDKVNPS